MRSGENVHSNSSPGVEVDAGCISWRKILVREHRPAYDLEERRHFLGAREIPLHDQRVDDGARRCLLPPVKLVER